MLVKITKFNKQKVTVDFVCPILDRSPIKTTMGESRTVAALRNQGVF